MPKRKAPEEPSTPQARRTRRNSPQPPLQSTPISPCADELNLGVPSLPLSPSRRAAAEPSTPGRRRVFDCVEIVTPRAKRAHADVRTDSQNPLWCPPETPSRRTRVGAGGGLPAGMAKLLHPLVPSTPSRRPPATPQRSPSRPHRTLPVSPSKSPAKRTHLKDTAGQSYPRSHTSLPATLPTYLTPCLRHQQRAVLAALQDFPGQFGECTDGAANANTAAYRQLKDLLLGSVKRGEGNSCLFLGPRGSGKTTIIEQVIASLPDPPIVIRLSGHVQHNDRLALREVARQLSQQTGRSFVGDAPDATDDQDCNPFTDAPLSVSLPPPSHLPALISFLPTLARPVVVVLDAFDLFAQHARQSLLYCLLDTVQSCSVGRGNNGLAVIGATCRLDTVNLLEKRVKSRFSGRVLRTAPPVALDDWIGLAREMLCVPVEGAEKEWAELWRLGVDRFLDDRKVVETLADTFALTRDVRMLQRLLIQLVADLRPTAPFPTQPKLASALAAQSRPQFSNLHHLPYPALCLLIAAAHAHTAGHDALTFEMLHAACREQLRASAAAPVHLPGAGAGGSGIGMARCTRHVFMSGFEGLLCAGMFVGVAAASGHASVAREFMRYRCVVERELVKRAVDATGQTSLKKWFYKAG